MSPETRETLRAELVAKCEAILKEHPENRCCKYTIAYLNSDEGKAMSNEGKCCLAWHELIRFAEKRRKHGGAIA